MFFWQNLPNPRYLWIPSTERLRVPGGRDLVPFLVFDQCAHDVFNLFSGSCRESPRHQNRDRIARNVGKSLSEEGDQPELGLLKSRRWFRRTCSREPPLFLCLQARPAPTTSRAVEASWRALLTAAAVASSPDLDSPGILSEQKSSGPASREPLLQGFMSAERWHSRNVDSAGRFHWGNLLDQERRTGPESARDWRNRRWTGLDIPSRKVSRSHAIAPRCDPPLPRTRPRAAVLCSADVLSSWRWGAYALQWGPAPTSRPAQSSP